ncbi:1,4-dihydroxy-6-naphthoate synthase [Bacillus sp. FSL W7-1360]
MNIAFSPCPNDTFIFYAWVHGKITGVSPPEVTYADIEQTNDWAVNQMGPDILKISYATLPSVLEHYQLIPCGGALGRGCGPLILTKSKQSAASLKQQTIAVPSERSTAYLLFGLWAEKHLGHELGRIVVMPFTDIMPAIEAGIVDAGLVIHEARFIYHTYGLHLLQDLGLWWEEETGQPIPLGAIIAKRHLDRDLIIRTITESVRYAWAQPQETMPYVLKHAETLTSDVASAHIELYVNHFTEQLGEDGYEAIETLLGRAAAAGLVPAFNPAQLRS